ncbi:MAG: molybdopterin-dependent oxidoreductase, partial [Pseudomonadota bacterium]
RVCVKGNALHETVGHAGRLLYPEVAGQHASWEAAINTVADRFSAVIDSHGPDAVAIYGSGQLLTEDYYVANKLMKGFIGSGNIDTNSRLCMASAVVAHKRAFGEDIVACDYRDVEDADLVVLVGSNTAWAHPVLYQRLVAAQQAHPNRRVVVIDPRTTATCNIAYRHLALAPGSDDWLFVGLLNWLAGHGALDPAWCDAHCDNLEAALDAARAHGSLARVSAATGLSTEQLADFYRLFARSEKVVTLFSMGINQSTNGSDKGNAIINCHLATGRIGKPGTGPFSITGQPNAMGGREVGGLANQLAAHRDFDDPKTVDTIANYWGSPRMAHAPGLKAVDLFEAVHAGEVKAIWIMATNPAVSVPNSTRVRDALARCEFVAVSDCMRETDTTAFADVLLPALAWGEKDGTVTSAERTISRQRAFLPRPGNARADWRIVCDVATAMGFGPAFDYPNAAGIFREHARLSHLLNGDGSRAFDIGALQSLSDAEYDALRPTTWPLSATGTPVRPFADGRFFTPSGRAHCVAVVPQAVPQHDTQLMLNTGRCRDQWHTMTRSSLSARLMQHRDEPFVELNPTDAGALAVSDGALVTLSGAVGRYTGRARLTPGITVGQVFA